IVAHVGADLVTQGQPFWRSNLEPIRNLSTVPDRVWKSANTKSAEGPTHFFEIDTYYSESDFDEIQNFPSSYVEAIQKYTESRVVENGTAPWRVRQLYRLALQALRVGDMKKALQYVGTMSHYVADLSQPLHVSENYDGQLTGNKGIHKFFETDIISDELQIRTDVKKRAQKLLQSRSFQKQFETQLMGTILQEVQRSISFEDEILKTDDQFGRSQKGAAAQLNLAKDRLADGAAIFSIILSRLWADSGLVARATPLTVKDPKWVRPDFQQLDFSRQATTIKAAFTKDDCSQ
ncbi:MAG: S1/P1 nuclease, partial [Pseudobdellovibrionaceae bacterium]